MATLDQTARIAAFLAAALFLAACGGSDDGDVSGEAETSDDAGSDSSEDAQTETSEVAGYPVTVDTVYGEITVEDKPERIVAVVGPYIDILGALGEEPVAFVGAPRASGDLVEGYPWLSDLDLDLSGHDLDLLAEGYTPSLEAIAAHEPDLILAQGEEWAVDEEMYAQISEIAPTYTNPHEFGEWAETLRDVAALTGTSDIAPDIIAEVDAEFVSARDRLPGVQGATFVVADVRDQDVILGTDRFLFEELGLEPDTELAASESISLESIDEITSDVVEVMAWRSPDVQGDLEADPRFAELPAVQNETVIFSDESLTTAVEAGPASIRWWLEQVVPQLEESELNTTDQ